MHHIDGTSLGQLQRASSSVGNRAGNDPSVEGHRLHVRAGSNAADRQHIEFELKWGLAVDPELGKRVKVTILATGFGIDDVDGMSSHLKKHTEEEAQRIAEEEERAAERQDRRNRYYGKDSNNTQYKRRPQIFRFRPEDLDNEDIILAVENTPTYKRTKQMLKDIMGTGVEEKEDNYTDNTVEGVISFV